MSTVSEQVDLHALEPDPFEPTSNEVERYVVALQGLAEDDPELAKERVWAQIRLAGQRAGRRPEEARDSLNRIFRLGAPPDPAIDGETEGILVTPVMPGGIEQGFRGLTNAWMPWAGKRFDSAQSTGDNILTPSARLPAKVQWPTYTPEELPDGRLVALKIDYDSDENPDFVIRQILDELVQVVPGANLGKVLMRRGRDKPFGLIGY